MSKKSQAEIEAEVRAVFAVENNLELVDRLLQRTREDPHHYGAVAHQVIRQIQKEHVTMWPAGAVVDTPAGRGSVVLNNASRAPIVCVRLDHDNSERHFLAAELRRLSVLELIAEAAQDD